MINFADYKKRLELETVEIDNVKLDVYFSYNQDYGFQIEFVEDITGTQDLLPLLGNAIIEEIEEQLIEIYRKNGSL